MIERFSLADRLSGIGASVAVVAAFFPWFRIDGAGDVVTVNAFRSGLFGALCFLAACSILVLLALRHGVVENPTASDLPEGRLLLGAGVAVPLLALLQVIVGSSGAHRPAIGLMVVGLAGAVCAWGGWRQYEDDQGLAGLAR